MHNIIIATLEDEYFERIAFGEEDDHSNEKVTKESHFDLQDTEAEDILKSIGIYRGQKSSEDMDHHEMPPMNRFWLHDTPGAINDAQVLNIISHPGDSVLHASFLCNCLQLINLLTSKELKLALPKKPLKPRTFILKPGQCMFLGGLARLDYEQV